MNKNTSSNGLNNLNPNTDDDAFEQFDTPQAKKHTPSALQTTTASFPPKSTPKKHTVDLDKKIRHKAIELLSKREHSQLELKNKIFRYFWTRWSSFSDTPTLEQDEMTSDMAPLDLNEQKIKLLSQIDQAIEHLQSQKWQSDQRFTEQVIHNRKHKFGRQRIAYELSQKGIDDADIQEALQNVAESELERAKHVWQKKFAKAATVQEKAKQIRFLAYRGFSFEIIRQVIKDADVMLDEALSRSDDDS